MATATVTDDLTTGKKDKRLEAAITAGLDAEITKRAVELAGGRDPKMFRSAAARDMLVRAAIILRKERAAASRQA